MPLANLEPGWETSRLLLSGRCVDCEPGNRRASQIIDDRDDVVDARLVTGRRADSVRRRHRRASWHRRVQHLLEADAPHPRCRLAAWPATLATRRPPNLVC